MGSRESTAASGAGLTVASTIVRTLVDAIDAFGVDGARVARSLGVVPHLLDDAQSRVDEPAVLELFRRAPSITGNSAFGLHAGERSARGAYGLVEYFIGSSATLRDGLTLLPGHYRLLSEGSAVAFDEDERFGHVSFFTPRRDQLRQEAEYFAATLVTVVRRATGGVDPAHVWLMHPRPDDTSEHARLFRAPLRFGAPRTTLAFPVSVLSRPLLSADDTLASLLRPVVSAALRQLPLHEDVVERLRANLSLMLGEGSASVVSAARSLGMSSRALQRALAERGTTYQSVLDDARRELALRYMAEPSRNLKEISSLLAFSKTSAFHRVFRRWTGKTPMAYRTEVLHRDARRPLLGRTSDPPPALR